MRIVFAGTPEFAQVALAALIEAAPAEGWEIALVLTQPDRPAGRGLKLKASAVKQLALNHGLAVDTPPTLSLQKGGEAAQAARQRIKEARPDVCVVAAYGLIVPADVLAMPSGLLMADGSRLQAINIHASLLPRWRGAAPVARAIEAGDSETGITLMQMDAGLDTGPMLLTEALAIQPQESCAALTQRLADLGAALLLRALKNPQALQAEPQPSAGITYAHKLSKQEAALDFSRSAEQLARQICAFDPFPGATAQWRTHTLKIWSATACAADVDVTDGAKTPGVIVRADASGIYVACGQGTLAITEAQRAGARRMRVDELLAGLPLRVGESLETPAQPAATA